MNTNDSKVNYTHRLSKSDIQKTFLVAKSLFHRSELQYYIFHDSNLASIPEHSRPYRKFLVRSFPYRHNKRFEHNVSHIQLLHCH